jgi:hypothetical protein
MDAVSAAASLDVHILQDRAFSQREDRLLAFRLTVASGAYRYAAAINGASNGAGLACGGGRRAGAAA